MMAEREIQATVKEIFGNLGVSYRESDTETSEQIMARLPDIPHVNVMKFEPKATDLSVVKPKRRVRSTVPVPST
jgi:hypothetical protein